MRFLQLQRGELRESEVVSAALTAKTLQRDHRYQFREQLVLQLPELRHVVLQVLRYDLRQFHPLVYQFWNYVQLNYVALCQYVVLCQLVDFLLLSQRLSCA